VSLTVTVKEQLDVFADASVALHVTVVAPFGKVDPDGGVQTTGPTPGQLSVAVGAVYETTAVQTPGAAGVVMFGGQAVSVGGCRSLTVTVNEQFAVRLLESVTVQFTVVVPFGKEDPEAGTQVGVIAPQLSVAVTVKIVTALHRLESVFLVIFAGQVITGGWLSFTVTVKVQVLLQVVALSCTVNISVNEPALPAVTFTD
jgi:hypothetical protein